MWLTVKIDSNYIKPENSSIFTEMLQERNILGTMFVIGKFQIHPFLKTILSKSSGFSAEDSKPTVDGKHPQIFVV